MKVAAAGAVAARMRSNRSRKGAARLKDTDLLVCQPCAEANRSRKGRHD